MITHNDSDGGRVAMALSNARCFELMKDALRKPAQLDCGPSVERSRQRFYRARRYCQARSIYRFDRLSFHVRGPTLVIKKRSVPTASQLGRGMPWCETPAENEGDSQ